MLPIPNELLQMVKTSINILLEAIEKDENPEQQIAYRTLVAQGSYDSTQGGYFQVVIELIVDHRYFLKDGDIEIITDPIHKPEPYKTMPAEDSQHDASGSLWADVREIFINDPNALQTLPGSFIIQRKDL